MLGSLNFIATTLDLRTKGMSLARMPITVWTWFITSVWFAGFRSSAASLPAAAFGQSCGHKLFHSGRTRDQRQLQPHAGGSPLLWQHLFWFFGHPEVYIAILPAIGIVLVDPARFRAKTILGGRAL